MTDRFLWNLECSTVPTVPKVSLAAVETPTTFDHLPRMTGDYGSLSCTKSNPTTILFEAQCLDPFRLYRDHVELKHRDGRFFCNSPYLYDKFGQDPEFCSPEITFKAQLMPDFRGPHDVNWTFELFVECHGSEQDETGSTWLGTHLISDCLDLELVLRALDEAQVRYIRHSPYANVGYMPAVTRAP